MINTTRSEIVFCLLVLWVTLIGCGGGSGGSGERGGGLPFVDGSATGGERNSVCLAGASTGEVVRPQFLMNLEGQTSWYASPVVGDLDGDGRNEVVGVPNIEKYVPYETQAYAIMVLEGAHGDGSRSAMRKRGWEALPRGEAPIAVAGWYPPNGIPAPTTVNIQGDTRPEIIVSLNDGFIHAYTADAMEIWRFNFTHGKAVMYASEAAVADLNQDGSPEIVFTTYGNPDVTDSGYLVILGADGSLLHDIALPDPGYNGNGNGAPAAPSIYDLDGDGQLEIFVQTFDHGMDVFTVPGSACNCIPWPTSRGGPLRMGQPNSNDL